MHLPCFWNLDACLLNTGSLIEVSYKICTIPRGWSGGAKVLGKLPVPGRPTNLENSRARAYCACSRCGWGCLDIFSLVYHFSFRSPSLWETVRYRLKYCLKGPLRPKHNQPTNTIPTTPSTVSLGRTLASERL